MSARRVPATRSLPAPRPMPVLCPVPVTRTASSPPFSSGQSATEYLLMLAAILILAIVAVALLGVFPNSSYDIRASTSATYWSSQAAPLLIPKHALSSDGILSVVVMNPGPSPLKLTKVDASGNGMGAPYSDPGVCHGRYPPTIPPVEIGGGRRANLSLNLSGFCALGQVYELWVNLTYSNMDSDLPARMQVGTEPLVGRCGDFLYVYDNSSGLPNGAPCKNQNECASNYCYNTGGGKICVECIGDGHCAPPCARCTDYVCVWTGG